jgi:hypothetical protein
VIAATVLLVLVEIRSAIRLALKRFFIKFFGTINITVMESSRDIVTGEVMAIFSFSLFPQKYIRLKWRTLDWMPL